MPVGIRGRCIVGYGSGTVAELAAHSSLGSQTFADAAAHGTEDIQACLRRNPLQFD